MQAARDGIGYGKRKTHICVRLPAFGDGVEIVPPDELHVYKYTWKKVNMEASKTAITILYQAKIQSLIALNSGAAVYVKLVRNGNPVGTLAGFALWLKQNRTIEFSGVFLSDIARTLKKLAALFDASEGLEDTPMVQAFALDASGDALKWVLQHDHVAPCGVFADLWNGCAHSVMKGKPLTNELFEELLAARDTLIRLLNHVQMFQRTHQIENLFRVAIFQNSWCSKPKTLSEIDTKPGAFGQCYYHAIRNELLRHDDIRTSNGTWIGMALFRLAKEYAKEASIHRIDSDQRRIARGMRRGVRDLRLLIEVSY